MGQVGRLLDQAAVRQEFFLGGQRQGHGAVPQLAAVIVEVDLGGRG